MLKEITFDEVEKMWEDGEIGRVLYIYSDGSDAYVDDNDRWTDIVKHRDNGGSFAVECEHSQCIYFGSKDCKRVCDIVSGKIAIEN